LNIYLANLLLSWQACRIFVITELILLTQSFIRFDAIKLLLVARSALNLYECAVSTSNADFRLYEFLKNSRVVRSISLNNKAVCLQTALVLMTHYGQSDKLSIKSVGGG